MKEPGQRTYTIDQFIEVIRENQAAAEIRQIILGIDDVNKAGQCGKTPLLIAAEKGHADVVQLLLEHTDIDPNRARRTDGATPLHLAALNGHANVVKLLLEHKDIDPNRAEKNMV